MRQKSNTSKNVNLHLWVSGFAIFIGVGGLLSIIGSQYFTNWPVVGEISSAVKTSWNSKDGINRFLMVSTYLSLVYLGNVAVSSIRSRSKLVRRIREIIDKPESKKPINRISIATRR